MTTDDAPARGGPTTRQWTHESTVFLLHILALFWPGVRVPVFNAHPRAPKIIDTWPEEDVTLLIEEGRRELDQQVADLERIRLRSQFVFTIALALLAGLFASVRPLATHNMATFLAWLVGVLMTALGLLGAASLMTTRSEFSAVDAAVLTWSSPPLRHKVGAAYARAVRVGANTVATRLTLYRDAAFCIVVGASGFATAWLIRTL